MANAVAVTSGQPNNISAEIFGDYLAECSAETISVIFSCFGILPKQFVSAEIDHFGQNFILRPNLHYRNKSRNCIILTEITLFLPK